MIARMLFASMLTAALLAAPGGTLSADGWKETAWSKGYMSRSRLLAGKAGGKTFAGVEIELGQGWKTYWRSPGEGGVPPRFDWKESENLAAAKVFYPAPRRFTDAAGDTIGYLGSVIFPVEIEPRDPGKPVHLRLSLEYGICKQICVPSEAMLDLVVDEATTGLPDALEAALGRVPRRAAERRSADPILEAVNATSAGGAPHLLISARFPGGAAGADVFLETAEGAYVPPAPIVDRNGDTVRFSVEIEDAGAPDRRGLTVTLVSEAGASEARLKPDCLLAGGVPRCAMAE